jgi:hypothetical protein
VAQLYPQALGSPFVASYDSQGYGGGIRPRLHMVTAILTGLDLGLLLYNVGSVRQRKYVSFPYPRKCLLTIRAPYQWTRRPVTGWFPRIHLHGNVFVY